MCTGKGIIKMISKEEPERKKKILFKASGGIHVGESFLYSAQASGPFGKIEIHKDKIILEFDMPDKALQRVARGFYNPGKLSDLKRIGEYNKNIPKKIVLSYKDIIGYSKTNIPVLSSVLGYGIRFVHKNKKYPSFLQMWFNRNNFKKIISFLESHNKKKIRIRHTLMENVIRIMTTSILIYLIGAFVFDYGLEIYWFIIYLAVIVIYYKFRNIWGRRVKNNFVK